MWLVPVKLDYLDVQISIKGNLKRANAFLTATNPSRPGLHGFLVGKLQRVICSLLGNERRKNDLKPLGNRDGVWVCS